MILKFKLLGSSVDAWEPPLEPVLLLVFRVLTNLKNKVISSNLSFVIPFNQIHDRAKSFTLNEMGKMLISLIVGNRKPVFWNSLYFIAQQYLP